jgi:transposase
MLGGNSGERLSERLGIQTSADTILRRLRAQSETATDPVRVLGVDDWAWRRGQRYGTLLVDLEAHRVIELLPDRSAQSLTRWLQGHPEVEVISRDRAGAYAEAAEKGAPQAVQVADRFHLVCNFSSAIERVLEQKMPQIGEAIRRDCTRPQQEYRPEAIARTAAETRKEERRERRLNRYNEVIEMYNRGMSQAEICRATGIEKKTVRRFLRAGVFPERARPRRRPAQLDNFQPYLRRRWGEGCHNATQLWREIKDKGYPGGRGMVAQFISKLRAKGTKYFRDSASRSKPTKLISPKTIAMLLTKPQESLGPTDHATLSLLLQHCPEINELQQLGAHFKQAIQLRSVEAFTTWMEQASRSAFGAIHRFASGLRRDEAAIAAAVSSSWSNGQVEGQVHRLKLIKRQMYGRASFQLLRRRILPYQQDRCFANTYRAP